MDQSTKRCRGCGETKPLEDFHRNRVRKDGRVDYCGPDWSKAEVDEVLDLFRGLDSEVRVYRG